MTVSSATVHTVQAPLKEPYTIAYETISEATNHFVVITLSDGMCGIGCAAPAPEVTGESINASRQALDLFARRAPGSDLDALPLPAERTPSARAAVDMARHDLLARVQGTTVAGLFGKSDAAAVPAETSITIGISGVESTLHRARRLYETGFRFFKIKGGHDVGLDLERLHALRATFGKHIRMALDANQGYDLGAIERLDTQASTLDLAYLEQPTPKHDLRQLGRAAELTRIPVMADESVQSASDVERIAACGPVALINIKLQKMGGLAAAERIDQAARKNAMGTMLGCMDESALSIAAALSFGATHPNVRFLDLDGHLDLREDPFESVVQLDDQGRLRIPSGKGLGWKDNTLGQDDIR